MAVPSNIKLTGDRRDDLGIIRRSGYTPGPASMPGFDYGGVHYVTPIVQGAFWDGQGWDMPVEGGGILDGLGNFFDDFADDFKSVHTLGQFVQNTTGSELLATLLDPAYNIVQDTLEPILFGAPGKDNVITGVEGGGLFDDPYISTLVNMFFPYVGAAAGVLNSQSDYENAKRQGYDVSYGDTVGRTTGSTLASMYLNSGDTYGYGDSNLGRAATSATTSAGLTAAQGGDEEQIARNATISGLSSYAGSTARDATSNTDMSDAPRGVDSQYSDQDTGLWSSGAAAGNLFGNLSNFGLRSLWKDPTANTDSDYYQRIINSLSSYRNQLNNSQTTPSSMADLEGIENTPGGQQLLALVQAQQEEDAASKKSKVGGSGQYGMGSDQVEQDMIREDSYLV